MISRSTVYEVNTERGCHTVDGINPRETEPAASIFETTPALPADACVRLLGNVGVVSFNRRVPGHDRKPSSMGALLPCGHCRKSVALSLITPHDAKPAVRNHQQVSSLVRASGTNRFGNEATGAIWN